MHTEQMPRNPPDQAMASRLRTARELAGFKNKVAAAAALKMGYSTYAGHENGCKGFLREAARYSAFFKVDLAWLITGRGTPRGDEAALFKRFQEFLRDQGE